MEKKKLHVIVLVVCLVPMLRVDAQTVNRAPHFIPGSGDLARFSLSENTPVGSPVYQLKGIDPEGSKLKYSISGPVFNVDRETGVIRLLQELDREQLNLLEVIISITDESLDGGELNTVSLRREIPVRDFNDNSPKFHNRPYSATLLESTALGHIIQINPPIVVTDKDEGVNAELHLSCYTDPAKENDRTCDYFDVSSIKNSEGNYSASITLIKSLDFESKPSYILTILAKDGSTQNTLFAYATVSIGLIDIQDQPPIFVNAPYSATIPENIESNTKIMSINATDGDTGNPRPITFSLVGEKLGCFRLDESTPGIADLITTEIPLDRENEDVLDNGGVYTFFIKATEVNGDETGDSATSQITIVLTDEDDHIPEFSQPSFNITIPENLEVDTPLPGLPIFVNDRDMGMNSRYKLSLKNVWNSEDVFAVFPSQGIQNTPIVVKIKNNEKLDFDVEDDSKRMFVFDIVASVHDQEISSTRVNIQLEDANDISPEFPQSNYHLRVEENSEIGLQIADIEASDMDTGNFGKLKYFVKGFGAEFFSTSEYGGVFVKKNLDFEEQKSFSLTLVAVDGGGRETNANLIIDVLDENDNSPVFESNEYTRTIRDGASVFEPQFFVQAKDIDGPSQGGGRVSYYIESENSISGHVFKIDPASGEIEITRPVSSEDTERGQYELMIGAQDFGTPPLKNTTKVLIRVGISGNQRPIFKGHFMGLVNGPPTYRVTIPENSKPGDNVTTVQATDPDGMDSFLRYKIVGANDNFKINEKSGLITVSTVSRLDRDLYEDSYQIVVNAIDAGFPIPETATTTVHVKIQDVNDKAPKFKHQTFTAYVSERSSIGNEIATVTAKDTDLNSKIKYSIIEPIYATTKQGLRMSPTSNFDFKKAFKIDENSGSIVLNQKLDLNTVSSITITVEARDHNALYNKEKQFDTAEVNVYIQLHKEINPVFLNDGWNSIEQNIQLKIKEEFPINFPIMELKAIDPLDEQPITDFELISDPDGYFTLSGSDVFLKKRLDYEELVSPNLKFVVKAYNDYKTNEAIANVHIIVENINDHSPIFEKNVYKATILESAKYPERLIQVSAVDNDAVLTEADSLQGFSSILYSLAGPNSALFVINNQTGEIQIAKTQKLDREKQSVLKLQVYAEDAQSEGKKTMAEVIIDVLDINDNAPIFNQKSYTAVIPENALRETRVLFVNATDPDEGPGGEIRYDFLNEGETLGLFHINPKSGEITTKTVLTGRGRSEPYEFSIRAQDNGNQVPKQQSLYSDVHLMIYIGDVSANDGIPFFVSPKIGQIANISENAPIDSPVFHVLASDPDSSQKPSGMLKYKIQNDIEDAKFFKIEALSGLVTTSQILDREVKPTYNIIIHVSDQGEPPQASTRVLTINVVDVDDHEPRFDRQIDSQPLELMVFEEQPVGAIFGNFSAIDEDIDENGAIDYAFVDGNELGYFKITRTQSNMAIISTNEVLDREKSQSFSLTVKCFKYDKKTPLILKSTRKLYNPKNMSEMKILVTIVDIDDHLPEFERENPTIGIRHNVPIDTSIYTLRAKDEDSSAADLEYRLLNITFNPQFYRRDNKSMQHLEKIFYLNNKTGEIRTTRSVSNYVDGFFELKIRVNNSEQPKRWQDNIVKIFVIRDKTLLRFVFARPPGEINPLIKEFADKLQNKLNSSDLELSVFDAQVLNKPDLSLDFSSTSSCFQMSRHGTALNVNDMRKIMDSEEMKNLLRETFLEYSVNYVDMCSFGKNYSSSSYMMTSSGTWLVVLAGLIGLASLVSLFSACLMFKSITRSRRHLNPMMQPRMVANSEIYGSSGPVMYAEPIYGPL